MKVVRFLEREKVIRFFGISLLLAPFINFTLHALVIKYQGQIAWSEFQFWSLLKSSNPISFILAVGSLVIGGNMLTGSTKAWKHVLILVGAHLLVQIINVNSKAWQGPLAWPTFLLNAGIFFFIFDQLVWKITPQTQAPIAATKPEEVISEPVVVKNEKKIINLKSYRKILFSFGSTKPWGELKTLSSEELGVRSFAPVPANIEQHVVEINFARDIVVEIKFDKKIDNMYYFKPLNMHKEQVTKLNKWLKKIAV